MTNPLPVPPKIKDTLLRCIETEAYEFGQDSDLVDLRAWLADLERLWPSMPDLPPGVDRFAQHPVTGDPHAK